MKYDNENQIKKQLGIESWNQLSKEKIKRFVAMMPDMDNEVMTKIIEQFPKFTEFANETLNVLKESISEINKSNEISFQMAMEIIKDTQKILSKQLELEDISFEERKYIIDNLMELARMSLAADSTNKKFLNGLGDKVLLGVGGALLTALVFVGGKLLLESNGNMSDDEL